MPHNRQAQKAKQEVIQLSELIAKTIESSLAMALQITDYMNYTHFLKGIQVNGDKYKYFFVIGKEGTQIYDNIEQIEDDVISEAENQQQHFVPRVTYPPENVIRKDNEPWYKPTNKNKYATKINKAFNQNKQDENED